VSHNAYWSAVRPYIRRNVLDGDDTWVIERWDLEGNRIKPDRHDLAEAYSWTVTDPDSIAFVARYAEGGLVDPMAGTGWWAAVLGRVGVDVVCYDVAPPEENDWHKGMALHVPVEVVEHGAEAVALHPDRTLLLSWPPYNEPVGNDILHAYPGSRVIYIGEGPYGCCGDKLMHERLERDWKEVDERIPVRWEGIYERITIYERSS
jgi:hypothetical protein